MHIVFFTLGDMLTSTACLEKR